MSFSLYRKNISGIKFENIESELDSNNLSSKKSVLVDLIYLQASGVTLPEKILMKIINTVFQKDDKELYRLLLYLFESIETRDSNKKLKPEFLLICDKIGKNLTHPNEYIRASTLRFVCRFDEPEIIRNITSSVYDSLNFEHDYIKRHAIISLGVIYKKWPDIVPNAPNDIANVLRKVSDPACKRACFMILCDIAKDKATEFLNEEFRDSALNMPISMQLTALHLIKNLISNSTKELYLYTLIELLNSPSDAVKMESAMLLLHLTTSKTACETSISVLMGLVEKYSTSSFCLTIVAFLERIMSTHMDLFQYCIMDLLTGLKSPSVKKKFAEILMKLVNNKNVTTIINSIINEFKNTLELKFDNLSNEFLNYVCETVFPHFISVYPSTIMPILTNLKKLDITKVSRVSSKIYDIYTYIANQNPNLRTDIVSHVESELHRINTPKCMIVALTFLALYSTNPETVKTIIDAFPEPENPEEITSKYERVFKGMNMCVMLAGELVTELPPSEMILLYRVVLAEVSINLARLVMKNGKYRDEAAKFVYRYNTLNNSDELKTRVFLGFSALKNQSEMYKDMIVKEFENYFGSNGLKSKNEFLETKRENLIVMKANSRLNFSHILGRNFANPSVQEETEIQDDYIVTPLTSTTEIIYCECKMYVRGFNIELILELYNQSGNELREVSLSLYSSRADRQITQPPVIKLGPHGHATLSVGFRETSSQTSYIFGIITYDESSITFNVALSPVLLPQNLFLRPKTISTELFAKLWSDCRWDKKIHIHTRSTVEEIVNKIKSTCKMDLLTPIPSELPFATLLLYSESLFGEKNLLNMSVERGNEFTDGYLRLRCSTQELATSFLRLIQSIHF